MGNFQTPQRGVLILKESSLHLLSEAGAAAEAPGSQGSPIRIGTRVPISASLGPSLPPVIPSCRFSLVTTLTWAPATARVLAKLPRPLLLFWTQ